MTEGRHDALDTARARIRELEARLEDSRRRADAAEAHLASITGRRWWRLLARIRHPFGRPAVSAAVRAGSAAGAPPSPPPGTDVRAFLQALPPEALAGPVVSSDAPYRLVDLAGAAYLLDRAAPRAVAASRLRIAWLGRPAHADAFALHAHVAVLEPRSWADTLAGHAPELVLIEAAATPQAAAWFDAGETGESPAPALRALLEDCRARGVPVACWFPDASADPGEWAFVRAAAQACFAGDPGHARALNAEGAHPLADVLPAFVEPAWNHPATSAPLLRAAARGRGYVLRDDLCAGLDADEAPELPEALQTRLLLVDSRWDVDARMLAARPGLAAHALGAVTPDERRMLLRMVGAEYIPETARTDVERQLQAAAAGALVVGPGALPWLRPEATDWGALLADPLARAQAAQRRIRQVLLEHATDCRLQQVVDALGLQRALRPAPERIACLLVTRRPHLLATCLQRFRDDLYPNKEMVVVVHGAEVDLDAFHAQLHPGERVRAFRLGDRYGLGDCLNFAFARTDAPYWAKWDDDDFYGPRYLSDFMMYRRAVDFDVAGKPMAFTWLEADGELRWDPRWGQRAHVLRTPVDTRNTGIAGATLFGHRRVLEATPFPASRRRGTDSEFLRRCHRDGWSVLSTDPFQFVRFRSDRPGFHTWDVDTQSIRQRTVCVGVAADIERVAFC